MALFEGKSPAEKKKIVAAMVLGVVSLFALYMAFGRSFFGGSTTTATVKGSPTPTPRTTTASGSNNQFRLPTNEENDLNMIVPVVYSPASSDAPGPGRNIFAFYEPPEPTPFVPPPPTPPPPAPTPTPPPPPPFTIANVSPGSVYAGAKGAVKLEIGGYGFTPDARVYFNQRELPTKFNNEQSLSATLPDTMIAAEGRPQIIVQTPDGRLYSDPSSMTVMAPPKPTSLQYIGMIGRKRYNNDTAYFVESGKQTPFGARLNDVVGGRFRVVDISAQEVIVQDTSLGFKHRIAMTTTPSGPSGAPPGGGFVPYTPGANPTIQGRPVVPPSQVQRPQPRPATSKDDVDDNDNP